MHLTARMAWHDSNWNGAICRNPEANTYCVGTHSLLSGRIAKKRNLQFEQDNKSKSLSLLNTDNIPPCYWSINAFGVETFKVEQGHAFSSIKDKIPEPVGPYSFFTWPFKLSYNHSKEKQKKHGNYPPDLELRIEDFTNKFVPGQSLVFFYANYDNPVSADDMKYLLIGCSLLSATPKRSWFPFNDDFIKEWSARSPKMKHFPKINWALLCHHDPNSLVVLPYQEYVQYVEQNPDEDEILHDMKVIIEEQSLIRGFKYVGMDIDDDKCLYLLYKIRKSIKKIQEHNQVVIKSDLKEEEHKIDNLIRLVWNKRGIYPSLHKTFNCFIEDSERSISLSKSIRRYTNEDRDVWTLFENVFAKNIPQDLREYKDDLLELVESRYFKKNYKSLLKLSLFNLTEFQINKIIESDKSKQRLLSHLQENPYLLYEDYISEESDLDEPDLTDEPIDVYKIDIGMIPDRRFVKRHRGLQNLPEDSPERIRSVMINYLLSIGNQGHCYDTIQNILQEIKSHPLIYKNNINIDEDAIVKPDDDYSSHFLEKLVKVKNDDGDFYYLKIIKKAEEQIEQYISSLVNRVDHVESNISFSRYIDSSLQKLRVQIPRMDEQTFKMERKQLYGNVFKKSFYLLTGKPGSGKTYETVNIINKLKNNLNQDVLVLAPTGKAVLRIKEILDTTSNLDVPVETVDRFIYSKGYGWAFDDWERLDNLANKDKQIVENLIIDECSMIDLIKLRVLFSIMRFDDKYPKRLIMVGDENQLPPIGFGKPFSDIILKVLSNQDFVKNHYVNLVSNCRQENDENILKLAEAFTDKKRYYEDAFELLEKEGRISDGLYVYKWNNKEELENSILRAVEETIDDEIRYEVIQIQEKLKNTDLVKYHKKYESELKELQETWGEWNQFQKLNHVFGLYENGYVNNQNYQFKKTLKLDNIQLLSPYRPGFFGTLGTNAMIQSNFREKDENSEDSVFFHSDKIIRLSNWYKGWGEKRKLFLSNGSIGIVVGDGKNRKFYFKDVDYPLTKIDDEDNFELAYSITVHKSQGSDFKNVFFILPNKLTLLSRELLYTALTRSKYRLFVFVQESSDDLLMRAKKISHLLIRNTSIFKSPDDNRGKYYPEKGKKPVISKIEWIIYNALKKSGLKFEYEEDLRLTKKSITIRPDFTIKIADEVIYWEHLGMLDTGKYYRDWQRRKRDYEDHGLLDKLVTTDDLEGGKQEIIDQVIKDIREKKLKNTPGNKFSKHHYQLY